jgi:hypothetical protein
VGRRPANQYAAPPTDSGLTSRAPEGHGASGPQGIREAAADGPFGERAHLMSSDPFSAETLGRLDRSNTDAYLQALAGIEAGTARRMVQIVQAVFGTELLAWSLGRTTIRQVHDNLDSTIDLVVR